MYSVHYAALMATVFAITGCGDAETMLPPTNSDVPVLRPAEEVCYEVQPHFDDAIERCLTGDYEAGLDCENLQGHVYQVTEQEISTCIHLLQTLSCNELSMSSYYPCFFD